MKGRKLVVICLTLLMVFNLVSAPQNVYGSTRKLAMYQMRLEAVNKKLGTKYRLPTEEELNEEGESYENLIEFYSKMNEREFWNYITEIYNRADGFTPIDNNNNEKSYSVERQEIPLGAYTKQQKYYYQGSSNKNYFWIKSTIISADGAERYTKTNSKGYSIVGYPYYKPRTFTCSINNLSRNTVCKVKCSKYLSKYLIDATDYSFSFTFKASGGDLYVPQRF